VIEFKEQLLTGMTVTNTTHSTFYDVYIMEQAIIQQISDLLPLRKWAAITSSVCNWMKSAYWKGRPAQMLLSMQRNTSWESGNFHEIREHGWDRDRLKIYQPEELFSCEAKLHSEFCQLPNSYVFEPMFNGYSGEHATTEQICLDHLAWTQNTNRFDFQYFVFGEKVANLDMFTGGDSDCPLIEINEVMQQMQQMGDYGTITNSHYLYSASPLIEHIYIDAFPPYRQDQIRFATFHEVAARPAILWDAKQRFAPQFMDDHGECISDVYISICTEAHNDADAAYAQRLQNSIDEKDQVVYSKRKLQMQEDAAFAQSLQLTADGDNSKKTRASKLADSGKAHTFKMALSEIEIAGAMGEASPKSQQMSSVNTRENLQMRLDLVTPLEDSEIHFLDSEGDDDQPMKTAQLEELEEVIHGQPYQPDQYSQANITFHGSPAETHDEDSD
jgi:hypothetical protein